MAYPFEPNHHESDPSAGFNAFPEDLPQASYASLEELFGVALRGLNWENLTADYKLSLIISGVDAKTVLQVEDRQYTLRAINQVSKHLARSDHTKYGSYGTRSPEGNGVDLHTFDISKYTVQVGILFLEHMYGVGDDEVFNPEHLGEAFDPARMNTNTPEIETFFRQNGALQTLEEELISYILSATSSGFDKNKLRELVHGSLLASINIYLLSKKIDLSPEPDPIEEIAKLLEQLVSGDYNPTEMYQKLDDQVVEVIKSEPAGYSNILCLWRKIQESPLSVNEVDISYNKLDPARGREVSVPSSLQDLVFWSAVIYLQSLNSGADLNGTFSEQQFSQEYDFEQFMSLVAEYDFSEDFEGEQELIELYDHLVAIAPSTDSNKDEILECIDSVMRIVATMHYLSLGVYTLDGGSISIGGHVYAPYSGNPYDLRIVDSHKGIYN